MEGIERTGIMLTRTSICNCYEKYITKPNNTPTSFSHRHSLEPMTGMDMPFSSLAVETSDVSEPSKTGGLGGVMLHSTGRERRGN